MEATTIRLTSGRDVRIRSLPLDESADELAEALYSFIESEDLRLEHELLKKVAVLSVRKFNPEIPEADIIDGLDIMVAREVVQCLNGLHPTQIP